MTGLDEIRVCTAYEIDGKTTDRFPPDARLLERATPVYETLPGFTADLAEARSMDDLPAEARAYLATISERLGVPISIVGTGPGREQTLRVEGRKG